MGGECWRRWEPHQTSRLWGKRYESWEFAGASAAWPASWLRNLRGARVSRVDVCWDFEVDPSLTADAVLERASARATARRISLGITGQDGVNTRYLGSASSVRRVRIYRKDLKDEAWEFQFGPTLRVEVVLRDALAQAWWQAWDRSESEGYAAAAGHVYEVTGRRVQADVGEVGRLAVPRETVGAVMVANFIRQNASMIEACAECGIDLFGLSGRQRERWGKGTGSRHRERVRAMEGLETEDVEGVLRAGEGMEGEGGA